MSPSVRIPVLLLIGWLIFGTWFWTCQVRGFCGEEMAALEPLDTTPVGEESALDELAEELRFAADEVRGRLTEAGPLQKVVQHLQQDTAVQLQIVGLYHPNENGPEGRNLGLARANFLAGLLNGQGIALDRLTRLPQQVSVALAQDTLPLGLRLSYVGSAPSPVPPTDQNAADVDTALVEAFTHQFYFGFNQRELTLNPEEQKLITQVMQFLRRDRHATVRLIGHTDDTDAAEYNYRLGLNRARSVQSYLEAFGIAADRIRVSSQGETKPLASNATLAGRRKNRRVELNVVTLR